jgi:DNA-binding MarR family transcriptional regulator
MIQHAVALLIPGIRKQKLHAHIGSRAEVTLNPSAYRVLARVGRVGPVRVSDVAANLGIEVSSLSRLLTPLTDAGLIERSSDPGDKRVTILSLTDAGRQAFEQLHYAWVDFINERLENWSQAEMAQFAAALLRFADSVAVFDVAPEVPVLDTARTRRSSSAAGSHRRGPRPED